MISIQEADEEEIEYVQWLVDNEVPLDDDRELWIYKEYIE